MLLREFLNNIHSEEKKVPDWVDYALKLAKIDIELKWPFYETEEEMFEERLRKYEEEQAKK